jgi:hypothetical protein
MEASNIQQQQQQLKAVAIGMAAKPGQQAGHMCFSLDFLYSETCE